MGSKASVDKKRHHSKPSDTVGNLLWALEETVSLEQLARDLDLQSLLAAQPEAYSDVVSQYLLLHSLVQQVGSLSVDNCKTRMKAVELCKKAAKTKRSPIEQLAIQDRQERLEGYLTEALGAYDNARSAIEWLTSDVRLHFEAQTIEHETKRIQAELQDLEHNMLPLGSLDKEIREKKKAHEKVKADREVHHQKLLVVALHYLDRNFSGYIEPSDMTDLSADLFNVLDKNNDHRISADELNQVLTTLAVKIQHAQQDIRSAESRFRTLQDEQKDLENQALGLPNDESIKLKQEVNMVKLVHNEQHSTKLEQIKSDLEKTKSSIYKSFQQGFIEETLAKLKQLNQSDLSAALSRALQDGQAKDVNIGMAETDIKIDLMEAEPIPSEKQLEDDDVKVPEYAAKQEEVTKVKVSALAEEEKLPLPSAPSIQSPSSSLAYKIEDAETTSEDEEPASPEKSTPQVKFIEETEEKRAEGAAEEGVVIQAA